MYCIVMIDQHTLNQQFRTTGLMIFVLVSACLLLLSLIVDLGIQSIPFSKSDNLYGHLKTFSADQWFNSFFSMANIVRIMGVVTVGLYLFGRWKRPSWLLCLVIPFIPVIAGGLFITSEYFLLVIMPWYLVIAVVMCPMILAELFFETIDGEFFVDGPGWLLQVGSWLLFCAACWLAQYVKRKKTST